MPSGTRITTALARQLILNFLKNKRGNSLPADETFGVWFDKESVLKALKLPPDTDTGDVNGIRFYFAAYTDHPECPTNPENQHKMTLVMMSTTETDNGPTDKVSTPSAQPSYDLSAAEDNFETNDGMICPPYNVDANSLVLPSML